MIEPEVVFHDSARAECRDVVDAIVAEIKTSGLTPVDTGALLAGYRAADTPDGAQVQTDVHYWKYVEYGHRIVAWGHETGKFQPAQPHVRPAVEAVRALRRAA
jgi:hypothetical protein